MYLYDEKFDSPKDIVNAFYKYFSSVFEVNNNIYQNYKLQNQPKVFTSPTFMFNRPT